ncbi:uncharacterized protein LOC128394987 isoform X2 [Panonychus citri]|nr:uncharacterized protein LOC128394987 isoform X2 [Panonychus citri]
MNKIRAKILATPDKARTEERIIELYRIYESLLNDIGQISGHLGIQAKSRSDQILEEISMERDLSDQFDRNQSRIEALLEQRNDLKGRMNITHVNCQQIADNLSSFTVTIAPAHDEVEQYRIHDVIQMFHRHLAQLLRPAGSIIYTDQNFRLDQSNFTLHIHPNNNEYLAIDDKLRSDIYFPSPQPSDYSQITLVQDASRAESGFYISENSSQNVFFRARSHLNVSAPIINHAVNHLPVIPWVVVDYTPN